MITKIVAVPLRKSYDSGEMQTDTKSNILLFEILSINRSYLNVSLFSYIWVER